MPSDPKRSAASLKHWWQSLIPAQRCRYCQIPTSDGALCRACQQVLTDNTPRCFQCALPLLSQGLYCGECLAKPPKFDRTICAASYQPPLSHWLRQFKDQRRLTDGHLLTQRLRDTVIQAYADDEWPQWLIPVPLHWRKTLSRSFNQSAWVAHQLHKQLAIPTLDALSRSASGRAQKDLDRRQRQRNLQGVFKLQRQAQQAIQGAHVAIIDDVITTTATTRLISHELKRHGARRVDVWGLARTDKSSPQH